MARWRLVNIISILTIFDDFLRTKWLEIPISLRKHILICWTLTCFTLILFWNWKKWVLDATSKFQQHRSFGALLLWSKVSIVCYKVGDEESQFPSLTSGPIEMLMQSMAVSMKNSTAILLLISAFFSALEANFLMLRHCWH